MLRSRDLSSLLGIAQGIVSAMSLQQVLEEIGETANRILNIDANTIRLWDRARDTLVLKFACGTDAENRPRELAVGADSVAARVLRTGKPIAVLDIAEEASYPSKGVVERESMTSLLTVPLKTEGGVIGVFSVYSIEKRSFSEEEVEMAGLFASLGAIAIERARLFEEVERLSVTDPLTGLFNRRYFNHIMEQEKQRVKRYHKPLSLLFADVDGLKAYNDRLGHLVGDEILKEVAKILRSNVRAADVVVRYGGDEFVVLMPETDQEEAQLVTERIERALRMWNMSPNIQDVWLSLSMGLKTADADHVETIVEEADGEMYSKKICMPKRSPAESSEQNKGLSENSLSGNGGGGEARIYEKAGHRDQGAQGSLSS
ncbi:two-component system, cell cycle response regulator [Candidatus Hakubella thermalkaliphila]|uniref:Two-component system, cell cycle response regulator n=1 Tax=Candidatus Hakubella thermalkaliphila TaxID=2754717 RepID=A0A6V8PR14_9ACTN|nr:sensor domain-containing diguanylate cyclase [Candidatus Hakubella thermalkaliphila]GFP34788.1 two-component system, cell cycle response regulator [Candidatus Hakubella thermalkaliphila]